MYMGKQTYGNGQLPRVKDPTHIGHVRNLILVRTVVFTIANTVYAPVYAPNLLVEMFL